MQCSEGAERDRYVNIYMDLVSTNKKLVHDQDDYFCPNPTFDRVKKFVGNHAEVIDELPKAITYNEYIKFKEFKKDYMNSNSTLQVLHGHRHSYKGTDFETKKQNKDNSMELN